MRRLVDREVTVFLEFREACRTNAIPLSRLPIQDISLVADFQGQSFAFFHRLDVLGMLSENQRTALVKQGNLPTDNSDKPVADISQEMTPREKLFAQQLLYQDALCDQMRAGENGQRDDARERVTKVFTKTSHLITRLTVIKKGERMFEPQLKPVPLTHEEKRARRRKWKVWKWKQYFDESIDNKFTLDQQQFRTDPNRVKQILGQAEVVGARAIYHLASGTPDLLFRLAIGIGLAQSANTALMSAEVGTLPHFASWAVALAPIVIRSLPRGFLRGINYSLIGRQIIRAGLGVPAGLGVLAVAEAASHAVTGRSIISEARAATEIPWDMLGQVVLANIFGKMAIGGVLAKIGNISGGMEDLVKTFGNKQRMLDEVSQLAYYEKKGNADQINRLANTEINRKDNGLLGRKLGWAPIAAFLQTAENSPDKLTPAMALRAAQSLHECRLFNEASFSTNPTRFSRITFYDRINEKHVFPQQLVRDFMREQMERVFTVTERSNWSEGEKREIINALGSDDPEKYAQEVQGRALKLQLATIAVFASGGAVLSGGWQAISKTPAIVNRFREISQDIFGPEVPFNVSRALDRSVGSLVQRTRSIVPSQAEQIVVTHSSDTSRVEDQIHSLAFLSKTLNSGSADTNEINPLLQQLGFGSRQQAAEFFRQTQAGGISLDDLEIIFTAASKQSPSDVWIHSLINQAKPGEAGSLTGRITSPDFRQNVAALIRQYNLAVDIERIVSQDGTVPGKTKTAAILKEFGLDISDPSVQLSYLDVANQQNVFFDQAGKPKGDVLVQSLTGTDGKVHKIAVIASQNPSVWEVLPDQENQTAEKALAFLQKIVSADPNQLQIATTNTGVDYAKYLAVIYESTNNNDPRANNVLAIIRNETGINNLTEDPQIFNTLAARLNPATAPQSLAALNQYLGQGITPGTTSVRFWESVVGRAGSKQEILNRADYYIRGLEKVWYPRDVAVNQNILKAATSATIENGAPVPRVPTLGEVIARQYDTKDLGNIAYPQRLRPTVITEGADVRRIWNGTILYDDPSPVPDDFVKKLLSVEGGSGIFGKDITSEESGPTFIAKMVERNLKYLAGKSETPSGVSGVSTQISEWLMTGKLGGPSLFTIPKDDNSYNLDEIQRLLGAIWFNQVPPEMSAALGLPPGESLPPVSDVSGINDAINLITQNILRWTPEKQQEKIKIIVDQLRQRVVAQVLERNFGDENLVKFYTDNIPLGMVGGQELRGYKAAARAFFGHQLSELSVPEQAMLAGLGQSTGEYDPIWHPNKFVNRGIAILHDNFLKKGLISQEQFEQYRTEMEGGIYQSRLHERFPISVNLNGKPVEIDTRLIDVGDNGEGYDHFWQTDAGKQVNKIGGGFLVKPPDEYVTQDVLPQIVKPNTNLLPTSLEYVGKEAGSISLKAPPSIQTAIKKVAAVIDTGKFEPGEAPRKMVIPIPQPSGRPAIAVNIPLIESSPDGIAIDRKPGLSVIIVNSQSEILSNYDPSGMMGPDAQIDPGSTSKILFTDAMVKIWGIDPYKKVPAWPSAVALNGTDQVIHNASIYPALDSNAAVGHLMMSPAEALRGSSANGPFNYVFKQILDKDPDAWRKLTQYFKDEYNLTLYDEKGQELVLPPALLTNVFVNRQNFVIANAKLFAQGNKNIVVQIMGNDQLPGDTFDVGTSRPWQLSPSDQAALFTNGGKVIPKSGTSNSSSMDYIEIITLPSGEQVVAFLSSKGVTLKNIAGKLVPIQTDLQELLGANQAYGGVQLRPLLNTLLAQIFPAAAKK